MTGVGNVNSNNDVYPSSTNGVGPKVTSTVDEKVVGTATTVKSLAHAIPNMEEQKDEAREQIGRTASLRDSQILAGNKKVTIDEGKIAIVETEEEEFDESDLEKFDSSFETTLNSNEGSPSISGTNTPEQSVGEGQGGVDSNTLTERLQEEVAKEKVAESDNADGSALGEEGRTNTDAQEDDSFGFSNLFGEDVPGSNANVTGGVNNGTGIIVPEVIVPEVIVPEVIVPEVIVPEVVVQEVNAGNNNGAAPVVVPAAAAAPAPIQAAAVAAIQDAANNDATHFTQEIIKNGIVSLLSLQGLVAGSQAEVKSHLATNPDGSYKLETHEMHGSNEVFYKINAKYTLTLKDANGHNILNDQNQPIQVTIERYIVIKTPVKPQEALKAASSYKQAMIQLAKNNATNTTAGRLGGADYTDANRAALLNQRDFTFLPTGQLSAVIPAAAAGQRDTTVTLNLAPKYAADSNHRYVRNFTGATTGKAKHKEIDPENEKLVSGKKIYQTKAEALKDARYTIKDRGSLFYEKLITHPKFDFKLFELQDDVKKKEQELKLLEEQFKESRLLGFGSKNKPGFEEFLTETASKYQDNFDATKLKEKTRYLQLEEEKAKLDIWARRREPLLTTGIDELEEFLNDTGVGGQDAATELNELDPRFQQHVRRQQLDIKEKLVGLRAVKNDLTPAQQAKITTLMALNDVTAINTELNNNADPVNNEIRLALSAQEIRIKTHAAIKEWQDELTEKAGTKQQLQQAEVQSQAKLDVFNQNLIRLENTQKELKTLTSRLSDLREKAENDADATRAENCKKIMGAITEKRIAELDKQSKKYKDLIVDLRKQLISAGVRREAPGGIVVGEA